MNKFGLIDIFTKLSQDKNAVKLLTNTVNSLLNKNPASLSEQTEEKKIVQAKKLKYSQEAILSLLKRHDELSKNIDLQIKNSPPEK